jgi:DNA invertase Pin-like site-specific DNA recombinase
MSEHSKLSVSHLRRQAFVYVRQSTQAQLERNVESTDRQYALVERAVELGFAREQIVVIDEDLGISGSGLAERSGFARLTAEVALGHAGLVLGLEASRLARNNVDWYRLLDLCGVTDTVIGDADGLYHPGSFNDRLLLGLKGTMSEAELHVLRARLDGGIRNKAARGELRRGLPVGLVWGERDGEVLLRPPVRRLPHMSEGTSGDRFVVPALTAVPIPARSLSPKRRRPGRGLRDARDGRPLGQTGAVVGAFAIPGRSERRPALERHTVVVVLSGHATLRHSGVSVAGGLRRARRASFRRARSGASVARADGAAHGPRQHWSDRKWADMWVALVAPKRRPR